MPTQNLVPELRFPEFEGEWIVKLYEDIYSFKTTNSYSRDNLNYEKGEVKNIHYGDIHTKFDSLFDITKEFVPFLNKDINTSRFPEESYLKEGDLVVADASEDYNDIGKTIEISNLNNKRVVAGLHTFLARRESDGMVNGFASFLMKTRKVRLEVMRIAQGTKVLGIATKRLAKIPLYLPQPEEQQRIATFLTAVDKRIQLLQQKKELLETYKKGVMQKLFSQELRFKDDKGNDFPDWEEKKLGELYSFKTTNSLSREKLNYESGTVKNIHYGDIHTKFKSHFQISKELVPYINPDIDLSRISYENYLQEGDLVVADASEDYADIGKAIEVVSVNQEKVVAGLHTLLARRKSNEIAIGFAGHLMKTRALRLEIMRIAQGTKVLSISTTRLREITIKQPTKAEQQKIASFISSLDEAIEKIEQQLEHSQHFKKGLLQKMFV